MNNVALNRQGIREFTEKLLHIDLACASPLEDVQATDAYAQWTEKEKKKGQIVLPVVSRILQITGEAMRARHMVPLEELPDIMIAALDKAQEEYERNIPAERRVRNNEILKETFSPESLKAVGLEKSHLDETTDYMNLSLLDLIYKMHEPAMQLFQECAANQPGREQAL